MEEMYNTVRQRRIMVANFVRELAESELVDEAFESGNVGLESLSLSNAEGNTVGHGASF